MPTEQDERLQNELSLLDAMYPDQIMWDWNSRELKYVSDSRSFRVRLPDGYLLNQLPEVLSATIKRADAREKLRNQIRTLNSGEELLDSIILTFNELPDTFARGEEIVEGSRPNTHDSRKATVIIWLHHLLNTNKRKQALSPASPDVSGVTKPGYPGVLVYSGLATAVYEHVDALKNLNWQAFQVRYESEEEWIFAHGVGVKEVEAMKGVVAEVGVERKERFMEAMRMK